MTNGRVSKRSQATIERLIAQRNALLDILNGICNYGLATNGKAEIFIPNEYTVGQPRYVVELRNVPGGDVLIQRRDMKLDTKGADLIVIPNLEETGAVV